MNGANPRTHLKVFVLILTLLVCSLPLTGCGNRKQRFRKTIVAAEKVRSGMTTDEVIALLGNPLKRYNYSTKDSGHVQKSMFIYRPPPNWASSFWMSLIGTERYEACVYVQFEDGRVQRTSIYPDEDMPFDPAEWKRSESDRRGCMVRDLLKTISFKGKTKAELAALLGPGEDSWAPEGSPPPNLLSYPVGNHLTGSFDGDDLVFRFDDDDKLVVYHMYGGNGTTITGP